jgi:F-type H+-transporting ATPase subunit delta
MARRTSAARRYAEAIGEIARRDGTPDAWLADLRLAAQVVAEPEVGRIVDNPAVPVAARREVLGALLAGRVSRLALNLVLLLATRGRVSLVPPIAAEYKRLLDRQRGVVTATVTSAMPLEPDHLAAVTERLRALTGLAVEVHPQLDPGLVGGLTVQVGDQLIDASVRGRLERLRDRLVAGAR